MKKLTSILLAAILLSSCLPNNVRVPQSPLLPFLERKSGLIAYIGVDGNIYTSDQAGNNITSYTTDALLPTEANNSFHYYLYPTWSRDSENLAFVGLSGNSNNMTANIYIAPVEEQAKKVFSNESERPFYLYWSPDNTNLGFLSSTSNGQSMILQSVSAEREDRMILDSGTPYYWSWAPNGRTMIVHTGSAQSSAPEHLAFLQVYGAIVEDGIDSKPAFFQSPAWSPDGSHILMTRINDEGKSEIIVTNAQGEYKKTLGTFNVNTAFAWSNQSDMVAYIEGKQQIAAGVYGTLHVLDVDTSEELFNDEQEAFAFFWSPDDEKIAYFLPKIANNTSSQEQSDSDSPTQPQLLLQLKMLDIKTGESKELFTFQPTEAFAAILPYFDQYHQSATIWSPDSNNLVLSFINSDGAPGIAVVAASGQLEPRLLTQGYLAFWSWK